MKQAAAESSEVLELAALVASKPLTDSSYKRAELIDGIASERARLAPYKYVNILFQQVYDYDGLTEYVYLLDGFNSEVDAIGAIKDDALQLLKQQTTRVAGSRMAWRLEPAGQPRLRPSPAPSGAVGSVFDWEYKIRGGPYDSKYNWFRVVGPFPHHIVSNDLVRFVNSDSELRSFFADVGEAISKKRPRPCAE